MNLVRLESETSPDEFACYLFECEACGDTERRLLPRNHHLLVSSPTVSPDDPNMEALSSAVTANVASSNEKSPQDDVARFLEDPGKFIARFVRGE